MVVGFSLFFFPFVRWTLDITPSKPNQRCKCNSTKTGCRESDRPKWKCGVFKNSHHTLLTVLVWMKHGSWTVWNMHFWLFYKRLYLINENILAICICEQLKECLTCGWWPDVLSSICMRERSSDVTRQRNVRWKTFILESWIASLWFPDETAKGNKRQKTVKHKLIYTEIWSRCSFRKRNHKKVLFKSLKQF